MNISGTSALLVFTLILNIDNVYSLHYAYATRCTSIYLLNFCYQILSTDYHLDLGSVQLASTRYNFSLCTHLTHCATYEVCVHKFYVSCSLLLTTAHTSFSWQQRKLHPHRKHRHSPEEGNTQRSHGSVSYDAQVLGTARRLLAFPCTC